MMARRKCCDLNFIVKLTWRMPLLALSLALYYIGVFPSLRLISLP
jgi:hypothetical protein